MVNAHINPIKIISIISEWPLTDFSISFLCINRLNLVNVLYIGIRFSFKSYQNNGVSINCGNMQNTQCDKAR